ncbi:heavy metal translocating P-type ATPase [Halogeometricum borinquense DSM 11551]|uniref:Heavy metal translocating P-type ATPase n=2 Tax=Halogeometricum borinquense (strain ATCC 700274 / DSM 11551 / JCM 10706 / KCTC 4070 / PR3) TaxID=469382 RepID=L9V491_HALBP|nr:cation-translocating P-type ATPase [Halogeometricum borinquense]ELY31178.1 heavy metal translocating P-type ATPase [Halogeometricum borinquense DSM 11551]
MSTASAQYDIGGMSCSFCVESIRKAYERTEGVEEVNVSLAHEEIRIQYDSAALSEVELKDTLRDLGYTIRDPDKQTQFEEQQQEVKRATRRVTLAGAAALVTAGLMLFMIFVRGTFESEARWMDLVTLGLALGTMFGPGRYIGVKAYNSLRRRIFNQHVLLEAGAFAGLVGGFLGLFVFPSFPTVHFFAVSVFITTYHILSEYTSLIVRSRSSQAVRGLLDLQPDTARRVRDGTVEEVEISELETDDHVRVNPGERIPVDGIVIAGETTVDESVVTGESVPGDKIPGDEVVGGSINETGTLLVEVTTTGDDAFLNQVARQIEKARTMKPGVVQLADRVLKYFVPSVLAVAAASFLFWVLVPVLWTGGPLGSEPNVKRGAFAALAVLVLGYPCALGMATPLALIRGGGLAANRGILLRSGDAFQIFQDVDTIVLDKTGTMTTGEPAVEAVVALRGDEHSVIRRAASAEVFSEHPLADAIREYANERSIEFSDPETFDSVTGKGVRATVEGEQTLVGKPGWLTEEGVDLMVARGDIDRLQERGETVVCVADDESVIGLVAIGDPVKNDADSTVERMRAAGITPVMSTGDNERTANAVAATVGIDRVMADVLPDDKRAEIRRLQDGGERVAMVGDGINDAPALTQADIGIAVGAGTDIAIESADIILMGDRLGGVMDAYEIAESSYRKTTQNLLAAFSFNGIGVTAATTGLVHPVFAMIAMILSVSAVLVNSFAGQLLRGESPNTAFAVDSGTAAADVDDSASTGCETKPDAADANTSAEPDTQNT